MAASKLCLANGSPLASARTQVAGPSPGAAAEAAAAARKAAAISTPTTSSPRRARAWAWRPGPQPTSSTRMPGRRPNALMRKATSCSVPRVNE